MKIQLSPNERILRLPEVKQRTGLARSSIYLKEKEKDFPPRISLGGRTVGWLESEVEAWIAAKIQASRSASINPTSSLAQEICCEEGAAHG